LKNDPKVSSIINASEIELTVRATRPARPGCPSGLLATGPRRAFRVKAVLFPKDGDSRLGGIHVTYMFVVVFLTGQSLKDLEGFHDWTKDLGARLRGVE
jgi:hypothetical protein